MLLGCNVLMMRGGMAGCLGEISTMAAAGVVPAKKPAASDNRFLRAHPVSSDAIESSVLRR
jgi:hypothetical protein